MRKLRLGSPPLELWERVNLWVPTRTGLVCRYPGRWPSGLKGLGIRSWAPTRQGLWRGAAAQALAALSRADGRTGACPPLPTLTPISCTPVMPRQPLSGSYGHLWPPAANGQPCAGPREASLPPPLPGLCGGRWCRALFVPAWASNSWAETTSRPTLMLQGLHLQQALPLTCLRVPGCCFTGTDSTPYPNSPRHGDSPVAPHRTDGAGGNRQRGCLKHCLDLRSTLPEDPLHSPLHFFSIDPLRPISGYPSQTQHEPHLRTPFHKPHMHPSHSLNPTLLSTSGSSLSQW